MAFRRMSSRLRPIDSVKHIVETSGILAAGTNTVGLNLLAGVDAYSLADTNGVPTGAKVFSMYLSVFIIAEGGEVANEVPLVDWYIIHSPGNVFTGFSASQLPTPGSTGDHINKRQIIHTEKGLTGGGEISLAGLPMIFKGVIRFPKGKQRVGQADSWKLCMRANFASKFCIQAIYKHYK